MILKNQSAKALTKHLECPIPKTLIDGLFCAKLLAVAAARDVNEHHQTMYGHSSREQLYRLQASSPTQGGVVVLMSVSAPLVTPAAVHKVIKDRFYMVLSNCLMSHKLSGSQEYITLSQLSVYL
jgi:hypothetical protein